MTTAARINQFLSEQQIRSNSLRIYSVVLHRVFMPWAINSGRNPAALNRADIVSFRKQMLDRRYSLHTICMYLSVLRKYYSWIEATFGEDNIAKAISNPRRKFSAISRQPISKEKVVEILHAIDIGKPQGRRDYALIRVLFTCGLRTIEAERITLADIRHQPPHTLSILGKGQYDNKTCPLALRTTRP